MPRLPAFSPQLDERLTAEFLAHSLELLPIPLHQDDAALDAWALRFERPEPPRDPDLPLLPAKIYPRPPIALVEETVRSLIPPPPVEGFIGRKAELDQAVLSLLSERPVVISGEGGSGRTALLRQIAHDPRIRKHFKRIWWLDDLDNAGATIGLALNAPNVLRAESADQARLSREFLMAAGTLLLIDDADNVEWALGFTPTIALVSTHPEVTAQVTHIRLGGLAPEAGVELLARLSGQTPTTVRPLAGLVNSQPGALEVMAALIAEDGITPAAITELLNGVTENPLAALYAMSYEALPEAFQALCRAFAASPRRWIDVDTVLASFPRPIVGQRTLTFIERRRFVERRGDTVRARGPWLSSVPPAESGFEPVSRPAARFTNQTGNPEEVARGRALIEQAVKWIDEVQDDKAEAALNEVLALRQAHDTDHAVAETLVAMARLAYLRGEDAAAIKKLEEAAEKLHGLRDEESLEVVRLALSRVYRRTGRLDAALSVLGDDAPPEDLLAVYQMRQEWPEAIAVCEKWLDRKSWARFALAETYIYAGRYSDALATIADSNVFEAHWLRAIIYHIQGDIDKAQNLYMRLRSDVPPSFRSVFARAYSRALAAAGEVHDAAMIVGAEGVWYEAKMPRPVFARQRLSQALFAHFTLMLGKDEDAEAAAKRALSIPGERPDPAAEAIAQRVLARVAWRRGDRDQALSALEAELKARGSMAYRDDHETGVTLHTIADIQRERGERDRAIANYRRALTHKDAIRDRNSVVLTRLALRDMLMQAGRQIEALEVGQEAIDLLLHRPEGDLQPLGYALSLQARHQFDFGRPQRGSLMLNTWLERLAARAEEGLEHPYWGVRALAIGLYLRSLPADGPTSVDSITLVDLAEQAVEAAESALPGSWVAWAARRDLGNVYLRLSRWADAYEVFEPLLTPEGPDMRAPFVTLAAHMGSALAAARLGEPDKAAQHYDAARKYEPDQHACGLIVLETAEMYRDAGDDVHAAERYGQALELLDRARAPAVYVQAIVALAYAKLRLRRFSDAIETFEEAIGIVQQMPNTEPGLMASVLFDMATAHFTLGQYKRAAATFKQSLSYQDGRKDVARYIETLTGMARSNMAAEDYQPALEAYHDVLQFETPDANLRRELLAEQASVFEHVGLTQAAIDSYRAALAIEGGSNVERAAMHRGLGALYAGINEHEKARGHFEAALAFVQDEQTGLTLRALGEGYRAQGNLPAAIKAYQDALAQLNRASYPVEMAATERALGEIYLGYGQIEEALEHLESALEIERALPQQDGGRIVNTLQSLAQAHELRGELDLAIRRHHEALVYRDARHAPEGYIETLRKLGRLYAQLTRYKDAIKAYDEAITTEQRQPEPDASRIDELTLEVADVYRAQGKLEAAANMYRRVVQSVAPGSAAIRDRASDALQTVEAEIARHLQTLRAAEQSWILLNRVAQPDLKGLAFVRALQAQTSAALGRIEESDNYLDQLMGLLKRRRNEVQPDDPRSVMRAMAMLVQGQEYEDAQRMEQAAKAYRYALETAEHDAKSDSALVWAIRQKAGRAGRNK